MRVPPTTPRLEMLQSWLSMIDDLHGQLMALRGQVLDEFHAEQQAAHSSQWQRTDVGGAA